MDGPHKKSLKEEGNAHYKAERYEEALETYSAALSCCKGSKEKSVLHNNMAQCLLKMSRYREAVEEASRCLEVCPDDIKALYRSCRAHRYLGDVTYAYEDAMTMMILEPDAKDVQTAFVEMANALRNLQGPLSEMEVSPKEHNEFEGNNGRALFNKCTKNPGHVGFIRLPKLQLSHLPVACQTPSFLEYIKYKAQETVKIMRYSLSPYRPKGVKGVPNMCGSGKIVVNQSLERSQQSSKDVEEMTFYVITANHVVFDQTEVENTYVEIFFDNDDDLSAVVKAKGVKLMHQNIEKDSTTFFIRLEAPEETARVKAILLSRQFRRTSLPTSNVTYTVSHPHGMAKRVTFGTPRDVKYEPYFDDETIKTLHQIVICKAAVFEKQVLFYFWYGNYFDSFKQMIESSNFSFEDVRNKVFTSILHEHLLVTPSKFELRNMHKLFCGMLDINAYNLQSMLSFVEDASQNAAFTQSQNDGDSAASGPHGSANPTSTVTVEELTSNIRVLRTRTQYILRENMQGRYQAERYVEPVTATYDLKTCPGTSGSRVYSIIVDKIDKPVECSVCHSTSNGRSGGGQTFLF